MIRRATTSFLAAALWLLTPAQARALDQTPDREDAQDASPWALALGVAGDRKSAYGFTSSLGWDVWRATTLHAGAHATQYMGDLTQANPGVSRSLAASGGVTQRFGRFALDVTLNHWQITHLVKANEFRFGGEATVGSFSGGLRGGFRKSTFASFASSAVLDLGGGPQLTPVTAGCKGKDTSWGADARYQGRVWGAHSSLTKYTYGDTTCNLYPAGGTGVSRNLNGSEFAVLAAAPLGRLQNIAMPVIGAQETLANSIVQGGFSWKHKDLGIAIDYLRQRDHFVGNLGKAYFITGTADLGEGTAVEATVGDTRGAGSTARGVFAGIGVRARF